MKPLFEFSHIEAVLVFIYSVVVIMHSIRFRLEQDHIKKPNFLDKMASYFHMAMMVFFLILGGYSLLRVYSTESIHIHIEFDI